MEDGNLKHCPYCYEKIHVDAVKCRYCKSMIDPPEVKGRWLRNRQDRMFLGICSCLAHNYAIPLPVVRLIFVILSFFHGLGLILYGILWAVIPFEDQGRPVAARLHHIVRDSVDGIKKAFEANVPSSGDKGGKGTGQPGD